MTHRQFHLKRHDSAVKNSARKLIEAAGRCRRSHPVGAEHLSDYVACVLACGRFIRPSDVLVVNQPTEIGHSRRNVTITLHCREKLLF